MVDNVHACVGQTATLVCTSSSTITVLRADYGKYADNCDVECCEPNSADCTQPMREIKQPRMGKPSGFLCLSGFFLHIMIISVVYKMLNRWFKVIDLIESVGEPFA